VYKTLRSGIALFLMGVIGVCTSLIFRTTLVIEGGIGVANAVQLAGWAVMGTGGVTSLIGTVPVIRNATRSSADKKRIGVLAAKNTPAVIRNEINHQKVHHPALATDLDRCLGQIDSMEKQRAKFDEVLRLSSSKESWGDIISLLSDAEDTILENFKRVILFGISYEDETVQKQVEYKMIIEEQLAKNEVLLNRCAEIRHHVTSLISGNSTCNSAELDAYLSVLRDMVAQKAPKEG
jgi:hypothetical protein